MLLRGRLVAVVVLSGIMPRSEQLAETRVGLVAQQRSCIMSAGTCLADFCFVLASCHMLLRGPCLLRLFVASVASQASDLRLGSVWKM